MTDRVNDTAREGGTGFYRLRDVLRIVPVSKSTLYEWISKGDFPPPVKLGGGRASAWPKRAVEGWCDEKANGGQA